MRIKDYLRKRSAGHGGNPSEGGGWNPSMLGASLLAWWNADRSDLITLSGNQVTSWRDIVSGYDMAQAVSGARPLYSATGFNGSPCVVADGGDDALSMTHAFPTGAAGGEMWILADQTSPASDATTRCLFAYGGTGLATQRRVRRSIASGINRVQAQIGDNATNPQIVDPLSDFSGRHIARVLVGSAQTDVGLDNGTLQSGAVVPTTDPGLARMFADANPSAGGFWLGSKREAIVTAPLTAEQSAQIMAYLMPRRNL